MFPDFTHMCIELFLFYICLNQGWRTYLISRATLWVTAV